MNVFLDTFLGVVILGLASAAVSVTITKTYMFAWLRDIVKARSKVGGELITCHYCMGHWVAAVLVASSNTWEGLYGWIVSWLAVTALSGVFSMKIMGLTK